MPARAHPGGVVVPRPGVVQTIGGALNQAFGRIGEMPDELVMLLHRLDGEADHFDGK